MWCARKHSGCRIGSQSLATTNMSPPVRRNPRAGATLIEIMSALLILTVIALGTAAGLRLSQSLANQQRDRRLALERANGRMEDIRGATFSAIVPGLKNYAVWYLDKIAGNWRISTTNRGESFILSSCPHPIITTVQYVDINGSSNSFNCIRLRVSTQYGWNTKDVIVLETLESLF